MELTRTCLSIFILSSLCSLGNDSLNGVFLSGEITYDINKMEIVKLKCQSIKEPIRHSVEFFVDNKTVETVRLDKGKCYHSKGECNEKICMCSEEGTVFTLTYHLLDKLNSHIFECQVRTLDEQSNIIKTTAILQYNGKDFLVLQPTHENVVINSVEIKNSNGNNGDTTAIIAGVSTSVVLLLAVGIVVLIVFCYKNRNETNDADRVQPLLSVHCEVEAICLPRLERSISENTHSSSPRECPNLTTSTTNFAPTHGEDFRSTSNNDQCEDLLQRCEKLYESNLKKEHNIDSDKKCTVGSMVMTSDNQLLIVDKENNCLKVLDEANMWHDINEPKSKYIRVTPLYKNFIAAIFSNEEKIQYIQISADKMVYTGKEIDLKTLGKSVCCFNIAYSKDHFAVRIELGLKGRFVILNTDGDILHIIWNSKRRFGDCNENSVEIALSYCERCIFISSFDKNEVYCVNFNGQTLWTTPVSCPKGILYVSNTNFLCQQNIILACQSPNVIYQIDSKSGKLTLLIEEKDGINVTKCIGYKETETEYLLYTDSNTGKIFEFSLTAQNFGT